MPFIQYTSVAFQVQRNNIIVNNPQVLARDFVKLKVLLNFVWFISGPLAQFTSFLSFLHILSNLNAPQRWFAGAKETFFPESTMFVKL